jgi:hypothetical protein
VPAWNPSVDMVKSQGLSDMLNQRLRPVERSVQTLRFLVEKHDEAGRTAKAGSGEAMG